jgi:hypothetical protein
MLNHLEPQEIIMTRTSTLKSLLVGGFLALTISTGAAVAAPLGFSLSIQSDVVEAGFVACGPGTHLGYEGKYCWPNRAVNACPPGFHLGYEGKYCWRNQY